MHTDNRDGYNDGIRVDMDMNRRTCNNDILQLVHSFKSSSALLFQCTLIIQQDYQTLANHVTSTPLYNYSFHQLNLWCFLKTGILRGLIQVNIFLKKDFSSPLDTF